MSADQASNEIKKALKSLQAAMKAQDLEAILAAYSEEYGDTQGNDKASRHDYFKGFIANGVFKNLKVDMDAMEVVADGENASAAPVTYITGAGTATFEYKFKRDQDGAWLIVSGGQIQTPPRPNDELDQVAASVTSQVMESDADRALLGDAGRLVDRHAMVWIRRLNAPVEEIWETVSTLEGLKKWWIIGTPSKFELKLGGDFQYHMSNTIAGFKENEYIDFVQSPGLHVTTGGMRFELNKIDDNTTMFMFLDTFGPEGSPGPVAGADALQGEQAGGSGTPWPGVAAGWHNLVDSLDSHINGTERVNSYEQLTDFYVGYLRDLYRWNAMVQYQSSN